MQDETIEFGSLLCSRLCHDLLSPVGALNNGLELLADETDPAMRGQIVDLLVDSARASADKLKFFRLAFGAAGGFGDRIDANEARVAVEALVKGNQRLALGWLVDEPTLPRGAMRIMLNLALIALDSLVRGGRLDIGMERGEIVVRAEGPRLVLDAGIAAILRGETAPPQSRTVGAALITALAAREGRRLMLAQQDGVILFGASAPAMADIAAG